MTFTVPRWLEPALGIAPSASGEETVAELTCTWPVPDWLTLLLVAAALALVVGSYLREGGGARRAGRLGLAALRLVLVALVWCMLAQLRLSLNRAELPLVAVMVDQTASMSIGDAYENSADDEAARDLLPGVAPDRRSRMALMQALVARDAGGLLRQLAGRFRLRVFTLSDTARPLTGDVDEILAALARLEPAGSATRVADSLQAVQDELRGTPPAAVLMFTDGQSTEGRDLIEISPGGAAQPRVPVLAGSKLYAVGMGSELPQRDLRLADLKVGEAVFVDDVVTFHANLQAIGLPNRKVQVTLRASDDKTLLASLLVTTPADDTPLPVRLTYQPHKEGRFEYVVEVQPQPEELQLDNNREQRVVVVHKGPIRVLLVQSYPNYEFRYLKQMLSRDATVSLQTVLQEADLDYATTDQAALRVFPERREDLFEYDVVLFGDVDPSFLSTAVLENLKAFVETKGGGIVFIAGPRFTPLAYANTPLADILPVRLAGTVVPNPDAVASEGFSVRPVKLDQAAVAGAPDADEPAGLLLGDTPEESQEIWRNLPPLYWMVESTQLKSGAQVFLDRQTNDDRWLPVVCGHEFGAGRVLLQATDETWRWRWRVGDVYFARYWVQTLRYLTRPQLQGHNRAAELKSDRKEYARGESVRLSARFVNPRFIPAEGEEVMVLVEQPGEGERRVPLARNGQNPHVFEGTFSQPPDGKYHAWIVSPALEGERPSVDFQVVPPQGEFERITMNAAELEAAAKISRGRFFRLRDTEQLAATLLDELPKGQQIAGQTLNAFPLWNRWPVLCAFLVLLLVEWILRKWLGML